MCGLFGVVSSSTLSKDQKNFITQAIFCGTLRGFHSTGLALVDKDNSVDVYKKALAGPDFIDSRIGERALDRVSSSFVVLGHNRAATKGSIMHRTAHPFEFGDIVGAHNGTIWNTTGLPVSKHPVDSMDLLDSLAQEGAKEKADYTKVLESVTGSYALTFYEKSSEIMWFVRNEDRPLVYYETKGSLYWASEGGMLYWLLSRNDLTEKDSQLRVLPTMTLQGFDTRNMEFLAPSKYTKKTYSYGNTGDVTGRGAGSGGYRNTPYKDPKSGDYVLNYTIAEALRAKLWAQDDKEVMLSFRDMKKVSHTGAKPKEAKYDMYGYAITNDQMAIPVSIWNLDEKEATDLMEHLSTAEVSNVVISSNIKGLIHKVVINKDTLQVMEFDDDGAFKMEVESSAEYIDPIKIVNEHNKARESKKKGGKQGKVHQLPHIKARDDLRDMSDNDNPDEPGDLAGETFRGPAGCYITLKDFNELTKDGCAACHANIFPHQSHDIGWLNNTQPICPRCVDIEIHSRDEMHELGDAL